MEVLSCSQSQLSYHATNGNDADGEFPLLQCENPYRPVPMPGDYTEVASMGDQPESNIWYEHILQWVLQRHKMLKKVEETSCWPQRYSQNCSICVRCGTYVSVRTCSTRPWLVTQTFSRALGSCCVRCTVTLPQMELFIVITMYNESKDIFCRSMQVSYGMSCICVNETGVRLGRGGWKKVMVCIVSNGQQKINSRTLSVIATMDMYQDGIAKVCTLMCRFVLYWCLA